MGRALTPCYCSSPVNGNCDIYHIATRLRWGRFVCLLHLRPVICDITIIIRTLLGPILKPLLPLAPICGMQDPAETCHMVLPHSLRLFPCHLLLPPDNYPLCAFPLSDRSRTIVHVPHSALTMPLVSTALAPLLSSSSQIPDSDPCRGPGLCILCTTLPCMPLAAVPYPTSSSALPGRDSVAAHGSIEPLAPDPVSVFHATS